MKFITTKDLGYNKANIVNIALHSPEIQARYDVLRNEVLANPEVVDVTATSFTPSVEGWHEGLHFEGRTETDEHMFFRMSGDYNFIDMFEMQVLAGRAFDRSFPTDLEKAFVLNESAVKSIGWSNAEAIGKEFGGGRVIGVVKDFHFRSLRRNTEPLAINVLTSFYKFAAVRINPVDASGTIGKLRTIWQELNPGVPFEYSFYEEEFEKLYRSDIKMKTIFRFFSFLSIFVSCLGLFGLSLFLIKRKTKEIGIRKVLGADLHHISVLLSGYFVKLIILSNCVALPVAYFVFNSWLQGFAYRIHIGVLTLMMSGIIVLVIAMATISFQVIKVSLINPVDVIKYE
jgi:putative ABC transport system permease protein